MRSFAGDLGGAAVAAAQRALHVPLEVQRGVLAREMQAAVAASLDPVEAGVLAGLEIGVGAAGVRIAGGPGVVRLAVVGPPRPRKVPLEVVEEIADQLRGREPLGRGET